ncbi:hypothetical protein [Polynucleobacter asymbioticus]|uniref:hypothetical protein n=1 Tax=Polynucleobacter asymbioticus TaxID=576611 RepID=UPI0008F915F2|nr:hypothetical protein [Polynucleobacter asymbioticus]
MLKNSWRKYGPYFLIGGILTALFYGTGFNRNWSFWADQELTLGYNALLINSSFSQEYLDHPGFFSIHLIAVLQKIASFFGLSPIQTIDQFNQLPSLFDGMRYLVISTRHAALITTFALISSIYYASNRIFRNGGVALLIALLAFVSNGVFYHFTATRTEAIAFLFLMLSLYYFIASYKSNGYKASFLLLICLIFFFCASLNKAQILILAPFYFCWTAFFITPERYQPYKPCNRYIDTLVSLLSYAAVLYFYSSKSAGTGFIFNALLVSFFNALIAGIAIKIQRKSPFNALTVFNACYLISFQLMEWVSTWVNRGDSVFGNIDDPMSMSRFLTGPSQLLNAQSTLLVSPSIGERLSSAATFAVSPLVETFGKISSPTLLIAFSIFWLIYQHIKGKQQLSNKEWLFAAFNLVSFYIVNLVNKIRYLDAPQYRIFSEFFLFTFALLLIYKLPNQHVQKRILGLLIFLTLLSNLVPYTNYYNWLIRKGSHPFCQSDLVHYHQKMDSQKIEFECAQPSAEH